MNTVRRKEEKRRKKLGERVQVLLCSQAFFTEGATRAKDPDLPDQVCTTPNNPASHLPQTEPKEPESGIYDPPHLNPQARVNAAKSGKARPIPLFGEQRQNGQRKHKRPSHEQFPARLSRGGVGNRTPCPTGG